MPHVRLALLVSGCWLVAAGLALAVDSMLPPGLPQLGLWAGLALASLGITLLLARRVDRRARRDLAAIAVAAGLSDRPGEIMSMGEIVARLGKRLERAQQFKMAISALGQPLAVVDDGGQILAASAGLTRLVRGAVEGASLDVLFGEGYLKSGGGVPEQSLVVLGGARFDVRRQVFATTRLLLEFRPAGTFVQDDDLDALVGAMASGQTGFRFDDRATAASATLAAFNRGMASLDEGLHQLESVVGGKGDMPDALTGPLGALAERINNSLSALNQQLQAERQARTRLESRLGQIGPLVENFEARLAHLHAEAAGNRDDAVFDEPYRFDVQRTPNEHMSFGRGGPHMCLGNALARIELRIMFEDLLTRDVTLERTGDIDYLRSNFVHGIKRMPVRVV